MKKKILLTSVLVLSLFLVVGCQEKKSTYDDNNTLSQIPSDNYCEKNEDCVPASCCHSIECINLKFKPNCEGIDCTHEVIPGRAYDSSDCLCQEKTCLNNESMSNFDEEIEGLFVDPQVVSDLESNDEVLVSVLLKGDRNLICDRTVRGCHAEYEKNADYYQGLEQEVLSTLDEGDIKLINMMSSSPSFSGYVTEKGLEKLITNPNVLRIDGDKVDFIDHLED
ncbi:hypothetical protein HYW21_01735 [Candidatus Woesearchaeota archaeon]|nr:hypothetical protein [Candidatus Woesearchaeota archaeon]